MTSASPSASLSPIERAIIADIHAVCRRCGWPTDVRPSFDGYLARRGHLYEKQIKRLGGWKKLCALGGMRGTATPEPDARRDVAARDFDSAVADVRAVAQLLRLKPGAPLTCAAYHRGGGLYNKDVISKLGGWVKLSAAAGVPSRRGYFRAVRCQRHEIRPAPSVRDFDAALDQVLGRAPLPRGILRMMGRERRKGRNAHTAVRREVPVLERGEVIADMRQV